VTGPLVDVEWLVSHRGDPRLRLADVRSEGSTALNRAAYDAGHIGGAVFFDMETDLVGPGEGRHPLPDAVGFAGLLGHRGIGDGDLVVVYDDAGGGAACRLWWMIRSLGGDVALLDGGLAAWRAMGGDIVTDVEPASPGTFATTGWSGVVDPDELLDRLGSVTLLDARSAERYRGENETLDPVAGHIPTARSRPYADNLTDDGFFLPTAELAELYADVAGDVVAYCGSGVTACHTLLAMEVAGVGDGMLYAGSWSGWISDPTRPQAVGSDPGRP
jgi:thiosulfate/3-mercaptopyruvate sulfurtransferase